MRYLVTYAEAIPNPKCKDFAPLEGETRTVEIIAKTLGDVRLMLNGWLIKDIEWGNEVEPSNENIEWFQGGRGHPLCCGKSGHLLLSELTFSSFCRD